METRLMDGEGPAPLYMADGKVELTEGMLLQQKNSECCKFWLCQPNIHWNVANYREELAVGEQFPVRATVIEDATWCGRTWSCCCPGSRETKYSVYPGEVDMQTIKKVNGRLDLTTLGEPMLTHEKRSTNGTFLLIPTPAGVIPWLCCCDLPYLETKDSKGNVLGRTQYICDRYCFVPKFSVEDAEGSETHRIRPDVFCGGCCVRCRCGGAGGKCCRVPFLIRGPDNQQMADAHITDLWAGIKKECCTRRNTWQVAFPKDATAEQKATLMGAALLLDVTLVEQDG